MRRTGAGAIAALASLALAQAAAAQAPATEVGANGNVFTGGLSFTPAEVTVPVGGIVRWKNTDAFVPHTSTEDHGLWDLGGDYGTPGQTGYAPGETAERAFEAGTHSYYCRIHPEDMRGTVAVAPELAVQRRRVRSRARTRQGRRRVVTRLTVTARWAAAEPAEGLAFDVQRRRAGTENWIPLRDGTRETSATFRGGRAPATWEVRARLRRADDPGAATDWSPAAQVSG